MTKEIIFGIGDEFLQREGLKARVEPWEDGMRTVGSRSDFEWWYFDAHFADGSTAVAVFFTKPLFNRQQELNPGIALTLTAPEGRKLFNWISIPRHLFSAGQDGCDVRMGKSWVRGDLHSYTLHVEGQVLSLDVSLSAVAPPWRPGSGKNYYDHHLKHYFAWLAAVPYGKVQGTLAYEGKKVKVSGYGYHDHNWGNINLANIMSHWYWGRAHVRDFTLIFVEMHTLPSYGGVKIPVFMLAKGDQVLIEDGKPLSLKLADIVEHPGGKQFPRQAKFLWQSAESKITISLTEPQTLEAANLLGSLPVWKQCLVRLWVNPYYFRFETQMDLSVDLKNLKAHEQGRALYEIMYLS